MELADWRAGLPPERCHRIELKTIAKLVIRQFKEYGIRDDLLEQVKFARMEEVENTSQMLTRVIRAAEFGCVGNPIHDFHQPPCHVLGIRRRYQIGDENETVLVQFRL